MTLLRIAGALDPHVHVRDLDWSHKATVESESAAALAGGYWAVLDMPNTPPVTTSADRLAEKSERFSEAARCDFGLYVGATQPDVGGGEGSLEAGSLEARYAAAAPGAVGLKMYCDRTTGDLLVADSSARAAHMSAWRRVSTKPIAVHAEGESVIDVLETAARLGTRVHFCHVSSADEMARLRAAKRDGVPLSVGVTPHHLYLTDDDRTRTLGPYALVKPALKSRADQAALWDAVADGTVDVVESDHAPHTRQEKDSAAPPYGVPGLETTLPLLALAVREGRLSADRLVELIAENPRRLFGLEAPAETYALVDMDASWVVDERELRTAVGWSPFAGMRVWGRVREVRIAGRLAFDGERVLAQPGDGRAVAWS